MRLLTNKLLLLFPVTLLLFLCGGCKTTESNFNFGKTDSLYIYSQFKTNYNNYPIYGPYSGKELDLVAEKGADYAVKSRTPFEENLTKVVKEVSESKGIVEVYDGIKAPFAVLVYGSRKIIDSTLEAEHARVLGINTLYKLTQQFKVYAYHNDSDSSELIGTIFINFNTFNFNTLGNTEIYREIYDRALNFIGKNTTEQVGFKYINGIGLSEPTSM